MYYALTFCFAAFLVFLYYRIKLGSLQKLGNSILQKTEIEIEEKKQQNIFKIKELENEHRGKMEKELVELRLLEKELEAKIQSFSDLEKKQQLLLQKEQEVERDRQEVERLKTELKERLRQCSELSLEEARHLYMAQIEKEMGAYLLAHKEETEKSAEGEATRILLTAMGRMALSCTFDATVTSVALPHDDMKRRIIGREGRNIRLLEQLTGVNYLLDEVPHEVVISSIDPIRREIARLSLTKLIADGRIHASFIEEVVAKATKEVEQEGTKEAMRSALALDIHDLPAEVLTTLGKLHFRYSGGQNLLHHSLEVGLLMKMMAEELQLSGEKAAKMGFLHDIGKALSAEEGKSHALAGYEFATRMHLPPDVANGIGAHHAEIVPLTLEAHLVKIADTISSARPGARRESIDRYIKRIHTMERICLEMEEVDKAYALQSGREVQVFVKPEKVTDDHAQALARALVMRFEKELPFTGRIKVVVIREKKIIDYAT